MEGQSETRITIETFSRNFFQKLFSQYTGDPNNGHSITVNIQLLDFFYSGNLMVQYSDILALQYQASCNQIVLYNHQNADAAKGRFL